MRHEHRSSTPDPIPMADHPAPAGDCDLWNGRPVQRGGGQHITWAVNQGVRFCVFAVMALTISRIPAQIFARFALPAYAVVLVALVLVELIGGVAGGSQRWINLGFMQLQPSEFMKPIIVLAVARFYAMLPVGEIRRWNAIWPALLLIGFPWALVLVQPDLGTATMIAAGGVTVM